MDVGSTPRTTTAQQVQDGGAVSAAPGPADRRSPTGAVSPVRVETEAALVAAALVHAVIAASVPVGSLLLQRGFEGLRIHPLAAAMIVGLGCGLAVYWTYTSVFTLTIGRLYGLFVALMALSVVAGMATVQDRTWWEHNSSRLGDPGERSGGLSNVTPVAAGSSSPRSRRSSSGSCDACTGARYCATHGARA